MYVRAGRPAFARPCVGIHKSTSLMSSSRLKKKKKKKKKKNQQKRIVPFKINLKKRTLFGWLFIYLFIIIIFLHIFYF